MPHGADDEVEEPGLLSIYAEVLGISFLAGLVFLLALGLEASGHLAAGWLDSHGKKVIGWAFDNLFSFVAHWIMIADAMLVVILVIQGLAETLLRAHAWAAGFSVSWKMRPKVEAAKKLRQMEDALRRANEGGSSTATFVPPRLVPPPPAEATGERSQAAKPEGLEIPPSSNGQGHPESPNSHDAQRRERTEA